MGPIIKSVLKQGIKDLPETFSTQAKSIPNVLKKQGIKQEELDFSMIDYAKEGKVAKQDLVDAESRRADQFGVEESKSKAYNYVSLPEGQGNPTYRETVYTFKNTATPADGSAEASRYTSAHFNEIPDYLMHARSYDDVIDGTPTRVVQEIQSDLHQEGRQVGYDTLSKDEKAEVLNLAKLEEENFNSLSKEQFARIDHYLDMLGMTADKMEELDKPIYEILTDMATSLPPESPYKSSWLKKGMEREIAAAALDGKQVAIPISGEVFHLKRSAGVQKWYETKVLDTAKKLAKANDMDFKLAYVSSGVNRDFHPNMNDMAYQLDRIRNRMTADRQSFTEVAKAFNKPDTAFNAYMQVPEFENLTRLVDNGTISIDQAVLKASNLIVETERMTEFAVITPKVDAESDMVSHMKVPSFSLYASPATTAFIGYQALKQGYSDEEVTGKLMESGYDEAEAAQMLQESKKVQQAVSMGYNEEEIKTHIDELEPQVDKRLPMNASIKQPPKMTAAFGIVYAKFIGKEEMSADEVYQHLQVVAPQSSFIVTSLAGFLGNEESARNVMEVTEAAAAKQIEIGKRLGMELRRTQDGMELQLEDGSWTPVGDNSFFGSVWDDLVRNKFENLGMTGGAIAGSIGGASLATRAGLKGLPVAAAFLVGGALGAAGIGVPGTELDYLHSSLLLQEEMDASVALRKALTTTEAAVVGELVGAGVFKAGASTWRAIKQAKGFITHNMPGRAVTALKESLFITDDAAQEAVDRLTRVSVKAVPGKNAAERKIAAVAITDPSAEGLVATASGIDPQMSMAVNKAIDMRAKDLLESTAKIADDDIGRVLTNELGVIQTMVKENYAQVKAVAANAPRANGFSFDYDTLAIEPVLDRLNKNIVDPDLSFKFLRQASKIRDMSSTRTFQDLLELRQLVNGFKFNKRITSTKDFNMLNKVISTIDDTIQVGAGDILDEPGKWLTSYKAANVSYAKMKSLEKNALIKVLTRPGVNEKVINQAMVKYSTALDDTFTEVLGALPKHTRASVEGSVIDSLANKYTAGLEGGVRATQFPMLADELDNITFTTPDARAMKKAIGRLAEVFRNDVPLSQSTGNIQLVKNQSFLAATPMARVKYELASGMINWVKGFAPTKKARVQSLLRVTAEVLEDPLKSKNIQALLDEVAGEIDVQPMIERIVMEAAKQQAETGTAGMPRIIMYGNGKVLTTKGTGAKQAIPAHRIASTKVINDVAEATGINIADKKALDHALRERGYMAVQLGAESVRRIN